MSDDLRMLLEEAAPRPTRPVDVEEVFARVERRHAVRRGAGAAVVLALVVALAGVVQLVGNEPLPVIQQMEETENADSCTERDGDRTISGIDFDGDGADDRARLGTDLRVGEPVETLTVCLADGTEHDVFSQVSDDDWSIEPADLGGEPGIVVIEELTLLPPGAEQRNGCLLRWVDGRARFVGPAGTRPALDEAPCWYELTAPRDTDVVVRHTFGCRPSSTRDGAFEVGELHVERPQGTGHSGQETQLEVWSIVGSDVGSAYVLGDGAPDAATVDPTLPDLPVITPDSDLRDVLRDLGFTPLCLAEQSPSSPGLAHAVDRACLVEDVGEVVDGVDLDLDADGRTDQVRLHRQDATSAWTDLTACFGNGTSGHINGDGWDVDAIEVVDLGGSPGIAVIAQVPQSDGETIAMFVRWADGRFGVQNESPPNPGAVDLAYGTFEGGMWLTHDPDTVDASSRLRQGDSPGRLTRETYGCRPSTVEGADFDLAIIWVAGVPLSDDVGPIGRWLRSLVPGDTEGWTFESRIDIRSAEGLGTMWIASATSNPRNSWGAPPLTLDSDLDQELRDRGFTPRCLPGE